MFKRDLKKKETYLKAHAMPEINILYPIYLINSKTDMYWSNFFHCIQSMIKWTLQVQVTLWEKQAILSLCAS